MMLENHLRHVKPSEFNSSVIWAGRIGLLLILLVAVLVVLPFAAEQMQGATVGASFAQSNQLYNTAPGYKSEQHAGTTLSMHIAIVNKQSSIELAPRAMLPNQWKIDSSTLDEKNWSQFAHQQGNE